MKRYLVFAFDEYYPSGGWDDFLKDFDTFGEAKKYIMEEHKKSKRDYYQIVDTQTRRVYGYNRYDVDRWLGLPPPPPPKLPKVPVSEKPKPFFRRVSVFEPSPLQLQRRAEFAEKMKKKRGKF